MHLRPTHPLRDINDLDEMIKKIIEDSTVDSIRSVCPTTVTPYKMWFKDENDNLKPVVTTDIVDAYNMPRQLLPQTYMQNASIDVVRSKTILEKNSMTGKTIKGYVISYNADIDTEEDYIHAEQLSIIKDSKKKKLKFCFDIDGIIALKTSNNDYTQSKPIKRNIELINTLYDMGHTIILFTARGSETKIDWKDLTKKQLKDWGVNYSELLFGKPNADFYIDDKFIEIPSIQQLIE